MSFTNIGARECAEPKPEIQKNGVLRCAVVVCCYNAAMLADARSQPRGLQVSPHMDNTKYIIHSIICTCASVTACQADTICVQAYCKMSHALNFKALCVKLKRSELKLLEGVVGDCSRSSCISSIHALISRSIPRSRGRPNIRTR